MSDGEYLLLYHLVMHAWFYSVWCWAADIVRGVPDAMHGHHTVVFKFSAAGIECTEREKESQCELLHLHIMVFALECVMCMGPDRAANLVGLPL